MDLFETLVSTNAVLISSHIFWRIKMDWKGSHFMVPFMLAAAILRAEDASISSFSFLALAMFTAIFDSTLWTRL
jgi:hypothetical protein